MKHRFIAATAFAAGLFASSALAGPAADAMSQCLIKSTTADDQAVLVQWIYVIFSSNPAVKTISTVTSEQASATNKKMATLFERLVFSDCHDETVQALKTEGPTAMRTSFESLGQTATRGLMSDPNVAVGMQGFAQDLDASKWQQLAKDAGVSAAGASP